VSCSFDLICHTALVFWTRAGREYTQDRSMSVAMGNLDVAAGDIVHHILGISLRFSI
jgi:hypothetical protein